MKHFSFKCKTTLHYSSIALRMMFVLQALLHFNVVKVTSVFCDVWIVHKNVLDDWGFLRYLSLLIGKEFCMFRTSFSFHIGGYVQSKQRERERERERDVIVTERLRNIHSKLSKPTQVVSVYQTFTPVSDFVSKQKLNNLKSGHSQERIHRAHTTFICSKIFLNKENLIEWQQGRFVLRVI